MTNAKRDSNSVTVSLAALQSDGVTPTQLRANPTTHGLLISDGTSGTDQSGGNVPAKRDDNSVPVLVATSNDGNSTPVMLYVDGSGNLLVKST